MPYFLQFHTKRKTREREGEYAKRSIIGAQFLLEIKARRSRRAFSISLRYSASTMGLAIGGTEGGREGGSCELWSENQIRLAQLIGDWLYLTLNEMIFPFPVYSFFIYRNYFSDWLGSISMGQRGRPITITPMNKLAHGSEHVDIILYDNRYLFIHSLLG